MSSLSDSRTRMESAVAEREVTKFAKDAKALIEIVDQAIGMQDVLTAIPGCPPGSPFMFAAAGLHTEPGTAVDVLVMQSGIAYTCDGDIVVWPVSVDKSDTRTPLEYLKSTDYRARLAEYVKANPGRVQRTIKQIRAYSDTLYGYIEARMGT